MNLFAFICAYLRLIRMTLVSLIQKNSLKRRKTRKKDSSESANVGINMICLAYLLDAKLELANFKELERIFSLLLPSFQYSINMVDEARDNHAQQIERAEIGNLVRSRMESLNLPSNDYDEVSEKRNHLSYVIINPSCDLKLEEGDIM